MIKLFKCPLCPDYPIRAFADDEDFSRHLVRAHAEHGFRTAYTSQAENACVCPCGAFCTFIRCKYWLSLAEHLREKGGAVVHLLEVGLGIYDHNALHQGVTHD